MATVENYRLCGDVSALLRDAPHAVESFSPGHWDLMCSLERTAREVVRRRDVEEVATFFSDVAYLKRPHTMIREDVRQAILKYPQEALASCEALTQLRTLDYAAMDVVARVPFFGRRGGRSFNSAVLRLVCPESFGVVDWRNAAVLCDSPGFDGLVTPPMVFLWFSKDDVLVKRGHLPFTRDVYRAYNDALRSLASIYRLRVADVDLVLWTYSIQRQPFVRFSLPAFTMNKGVGEGDRRALRQPQNRHSVVSRCVQEYLTRLAEVGVLSREQILAELCSVFALVRSECDEFGRTRMGRLRDRVLPIVGALDAAIGSRDPERMLGLWQRWQAMVDTSSPNYIGINLPADMILDGYLILEDFIPFKEHIESHYHTSTLEPRYECD